MTNLINLTRCKALIVLILVSINFHVLAQENDKKFQINPGLEIGFSKTEINGNSLNTSTNGGFINIQYNLKYINIESGLAYSASQGNFNVEGNSYFLKNEYFSIPLGVNTQIGFGKNENANKSPKLHLGFGFYANSLMKSEIEDLSKETDLGWNFGYYTQFGINIKSSDILSLNVGIKNQQDFSEIKNSEAYSVKQNRNVVYVNCGMKL